MEKDFDGADTQAHTAAEAQSESIIVIQASSQMNPNAVSFRPLKDKLAREKKGKPKVKLADESRIAIYTGLAAGDSELTEPSDYEDALKSAQSSRQSMACSDGIRNWFAIQESNLDSDKTSSWPERG